jgi:hypothetical protein
MNPILDQLLVGGLILAAIAFFLIRGLRGKKGCGQGCNCSAARPRNLDGRGNSTDINP